jgi:hypothetical protein
MFFTFMLTAKSTERNSQPQMKKKGTALLAGYFAFLVPYAQLLKRKY